MQVLKNISEQLFYRIPAQCCFFYRLQKPTLIPLESSLNIPKKLLPQRYVSKICYEGLLIPFQELQKAELQYVLNLFFFRHNNFESLGKTYFSDLQCFYNVFTRHFPLFPQFLFTTVKTKQSIVKKKLGQILRKILGIWLQQQRIKIISQLTFHRKSYFTQFCRFKTNIRKRLQFPLKHKFCNKRLFPVNDSAFNRGARLGKKTQRRI